MKRWWLCSAIFFKLIDVVSTYYAVSIRIAREGNPVVAYAISRIGLGWSMIIDFVISFVALILLYDAAATRKKYLSIYIINVVLFGVVVSNILKIIQRGF
jgi:hypothetical protein